MVALTGVGQGPALLSGHAALHFERWLWHHILLPFALHFQLSRPLLLGCDYPQCDLNFWLFRENGCWGKNTLWLKPGYGISYVFMQQEV